MILGAAGDQPQSCLGYLGSHGSGVGDHLLGVAGKVRLEGLAEQTALAR